MVKDISHNICSTYNITKITCIGMESNSFLYSITLKEYTGVTSHHVMHMDKCRTSLPSLTVVNTDNLRYERLGSPVNEYFSSGYSEDKDGSSLWNLYVSSAYSPVCSAPIS